MEKLGFRLDAKSGSFEQWVNGAIVVSGYRFSSGNNWKASSFEQNGHIVWLRRKSGGSARMFGSPEAAAKAALEAWN